MRAALLREVDGPFEIREVPEPAADGKALVRVRAAGINFADVLVRRGRYPQMPELPAVLGSEIAGELEDGTRVMAITSGAGGYAEVVAVDPAQVVPLPDDASFAEGASFLLTFLTAYIPLTRQVRVRPGSTVLVYAAAGGVGSAAIQVARALGAEVVAAVGSEDKLDVCRSLGAAEAYVYDALPDELVADVIVDPIGGELFAASFARLRPLGTVVAIGSAAGAWPEVEPGRRLTFRWLPFQQTGDGELVAVPSTRVDIMLDPVPDGTRVRVIEQRAFSPGVSLRTRSSEPMLAAV